LRELNRTRGQTFLVVTHAREVGLQCDRIVHMKDGLILNEEITGALSPDSSASTVAVRHSGSGS